jgi:opacity protein-like surface antigen
MSIVEANKAKYNIKMKRTLKYTVLIIVLLLPLTSFSQRWKLRRTEVIVGLGGTDYNGDIEKRSGFPGFKTIDLSYIRPNIGIGGRYRLTERQSIKGNLTFAYLEGSDEGTANEGSRDFAFITSLYEFNLQYEYSLIPENNPVNYSLGKLWDGLRSNNANLNTYLFAGLGGSYFKPVPKANMEGHEDFTENKNLSLVLPVGAGIKYPITRNIFLGFEIGRRFTTTDYIDGYTSEYSNWPDSYYFSQLNVVLKIDTYYNRRLRP